MKAKGPNKWDEVPVWVLQPTYPLCMYSQMCECCSGAAEEYRWRKAAGGQRGEDGRETEPCSPGLLTSLNPFLLS